MMRLLAAARQQQQQQQSHDPEEPEQQQYHRSSDAADASVIEALALPSLAASPQRHKNQRQEPMPDNASSNGPFLSDRKKKTPSSLPSKHPQIKRWRRRRRQVLLLLVLLLAALSSSLSRITTTTTFSTEAILPGIPQQQQETSTRTRTDPQPAKDQDNDDDQFVPTFRRNYGKFLTFAGSDNAATAAAAAAQNDGDSNPSNDNPQSTSKASAAHPRRQRKEHDPFCPDFLRQSSLYQSVYVYPSPGQEDYRLESNILSEEMKEWIRQQQQEHQNDDHHNNINATFTIPPWPFLQDDYAAWRHERSFYNPQGSSHDQYNTEQLVRLLLGGTCLTTSHPETATLFLVPYLPSMEHFHGSPLKQDWDRSTSVYAKAILDILGGEQFPSTAMPNGAKRRRSRRNHPNATGSTSTQQQTLYNHHRHSTPNYTLWQSPQAFGLTSRYWQRRGGADHILVVSEPGVGLTRPRGYKGNLHYIYTQFQLAPTVVISKEVSQTFVRQYPACSLAKNILLPHPNTDAAWFDGTYASQARAAERAMEAWFWDDNSSNGDGASDSSNVSSTTNNWNLLNGASLPAEQELRRRQHPQIETKLENDQSATMNKYFFNHSLLFSPRPVAQFYQAGAHGACKGLRKSLGGDYKCTGSHSVWNGMLTKELTRRWKDLTATILEDASRPNNETLAAMAAILGKTTTTTTTFGSNAAAPRTRLFTKKSDNLYFDYRWAMPLTTFCPCPGGDTPSAKRMFDAIHAGCIPVILSADFVWPFVNEFDGDDGNATTNRNVDRKDDKDLFRPQGMPRPEEFSISLRGSKFRRPHYKQEIKKKLSQKKTQQQQTTKAPQQPSCKVDPRSNNMGLQALLEGISAQQIERLRRGMARARQYYAWYSPADIAASGSTSPLRDGVIPTGGVARMLVQMLEQRAAGARYAPCRAELDAFDRKQKWPEEVTKFQC